MSKTQSIEIKSLSLDLENFRTTRQKNEEDAIRAMIVIKPDKFHGLIHSLIDDGYLPTDNIIVLDDGKIKLVKEGNRRIAILKILHGQYDVDDFSLPGNIVAKIKNVTPQWKKENLKVPCAIYGLTESKLADKIVNLAHGKGEKANRDQWTSVARARHNRDSNKVTEPALDLLEKYLIHGQNLTNSQKELWAGDYNLSVLVEAINKLLPRLEVVNIAELVTKYPKVKFKNELEAILRDIGLDLLGFPKIRDKQKDFAQDYGIVPLQQPAATSTNGTTSTNSNSTTSPNTTSTSTTGAGTSSSNTTSPSSTQNNTNGTTTPKSINAYATNDPKNVTNLLKKFTPKGANRSKVVTLRDEMRNINLKNNPIAFCFLVRSIFEISAKVYSQENNISLVDKNGNTLNLSKLLEKVVNHLTNNGKNVPKTQLLHGALNEIKTSDRILSVTSLNQLVHSPAYTITTSDVCTFFAKIYQLLEEMN